jgi:hypothetical protein
MSQILNKVNNTLSDLDRNLSVLNYEEDGLVRLSLFSFVSAAIEPFNIKFDLNDKAKPRGQVSFEFVGSE